LEGRVGEGGKENQLSRTLVKNCTRGSSKKKAGGPPLQGSSEEKTNKTRRGREKKNWLKDHLKLRDCKVPGGGKAMGKGKIRMSCFLLKKKIKKSSQKRRDKREIGECRGKWGVGPTKGWKVSLAEGTWALSLERAPKDFYV